MKEFKSVAVQFYETNKTERLSFWTLLAKEESNQRIKIAIHEESVNP